MITVETYNSTYEIDLEAATARRIPENGDGMRALRGDDEAMPLLHLQPIEQGKPMVMLLMLRDDGVPTLRQTSPVVSITGL